MDDVTAFVLAGGKSLRMGTDKALLPLGSETLLQRALRIAGAVCPKPMILADSGSYASFGDVIEDRMPGCGPLGGIHAALCVTKSDRNLILSAEMPLMTSEFLRWLVSLASNDDTLATVPQPGARNQPLCAVYRREMLPVIERALAAGECKVDRIFAQVPTRYLSDSEIRTAGFNEDIFANINTPEEYEGLQRRFASDALAGSQGSRR